MDDLEIGGRNLRLADQVLEDVPVLDFTDAQDGMVAPVVVSHRPDDRCHVVELLLILGFRPVVGTVGKILVVILAFVVVGIKEILQVVESDDIARSDLLREGADGQGKRKDDQDMFTHNDVNFIQ